MDFKERVFQARRAKGYSQEDLAEMVNVSRQAVSKWETGEAMPDMEKFIALCDALDLSMEYLALGKQSAAPAPAPKKGLRWLGVSLLAALCLAAGFTAGYLRPQPQSPAETCPTVPQTGLTQPQISPSQPAVPKDSPVADVTVDATKKTQIKIAILPATLTDGMEVQILCQNKITDKTETLNCNFDGSYYRVDLPRDKEFHYYITATLESNGKKEQLPILELSGDKSSCLTRHIWKNG